VLYELHTASNLMILGRRVRVSRGQWSLLIYNLIVGGLDKDERWIWNTRLFYDHPMHTSRIETPLTSKV